MAGYMRMSRHLRGSRMRGFSLTEVVVSVAVSAFVFSFAGFLVFMASVNISNLHDQIVSQTAAAAASERVASILRSAINFSRYADDESTAAVTRVLAAIPKVGSVSSVDTTACVCIDPPSSANNYRGTVCIFRDAGVAGEAISFHDVTYDGRTYKAPVSPNNADYKYHGISDLEFGYENEFRLEMRMYFEYNGFAMRFNRPVVFQRGQLLTDVVAKNHFINQGTGSLWLEDSYEIDDLGEPSPAHL